jgi:hypothetical protein
MAIIASPGATSQVMPLDLCMLVSITACTSENTFSQTSENPVMANFGELLPTFIDVSQAHILDDAQGDRGWLENASPSVMAVEELPLDPPGGPDR